MPRQIDWKFLEREEKPRVLEGYVPRHNDGTPYNKSGVTIATGVDLGARDAAEIMRLPVSDLLRRKLSAYAKFKGWGAVEILKKKPLTITIAEANELDRAIKTELIERMIRRFEEDAGFDFDSMPAQFQTVMASLAWQWGPNFEDVPAMRQVWKAAVSGQIRHMADLLDAQTAFAKRRDREAALLREIR